MIQIEALDYRYRKQDKLFQQLDLLLKPGSICGLLGLNGAGKSTLLKLMAGLLFPKAGGLKVMGHVPGKREVPFLENIFMLPEAFSLPVMSMDAYLKHYASFYPAFDRNMYQEALHEFELKPVDKLTHLSHGQQKKFLIAFAFATQAKCMLLDEPTNGLDIPSKQQFRKLLAGYVDSDRTVVISTHQVKDIENLIDPVVILHEGAILFNQSHEQIQEKLVFDDVAEEPKQCLYAEKSLGGYSTVRENYEGSVSAVDLELLFKTVLHNKVGIATCFEGVLS
jgi:ABC-2 type transport system ATP-binding protein